jgi:hypothetical protein
LRADLEELGKSNYDDAQRTDIEALMRAQLQLNQNNTQFVRKAKIDASTWGRIRRGVYRSSNLRAHIADLKLHSSNLFSQAAITADRKKAGLHQRPYFPTAEFDAVKTAIDTVLSDDAENCEDKAIWVIGRYGSGKTELGKQIIKTGVNGWMMTARPVWRRSYFAALQAIARELRLQTKQSSAVALETDIIDHLQTSAGVLIFNEVESLHPDIWNFMRTVCNETPCAVLILITPEYYSLLKRRGGTGPSQLLRRGEGTFEIRDLTDGQVARFFRHYWPAAKADAAMCERLRKEANTFGAFSCVSRVIGYMVKDLHGTADTPNHELLEKKITAYRAACPVPASAMPRVA